MPNRTAQHEADMDQSTRSEIAKRNKRLALIHVCLALGILAFFVWHTAQHA